MKKILIGLLFTFFMITNVNAEVEVKLKNDEFVPGKTIEVDIDQMKDMDSAIYNAWLEKNIEYKWYLDGTIIINQTSNKLTIKEEYQGKEIHVKVICLGEEFEGGPYKIEKIINETPDVENVPILEEDTNSEENIATKSEEVNEDKLPPERDTNIIIYIIGGLLVVVAFILGFVIGNSKNKKEE